MPKLQQPAWSLVSALRICAHLKTCIVLVEEYVLKYLGVLATQVLLSRKLSKLKATTQLHLRYYKNVPT